MAEASHPDHDPNRKTRIGRGNEGIDAVYLPGDSSLLGENLEKLEIAYGFRLRYGVITEEHYDAAMEFIRMLEEANEQAIAIEEGGVVYDDERETAMELFRREVPKGSGKFMHYLVARPDFDPGDFLKSIEGDVNKMRVYQEISIAIADNIESPPRNIEPIMFPTDTTYEDDIHAALLAEAAVAHERHVITDKERDTISAALLYRDIFGKDVASYYIQEGEDGQYWRIYEFPHDEEA